MINRIKSVADEPIRAKYAVANFHVPRFSSYFPDCSASLFENASLLVSRGTSVYQNGKQVQQPRVYLNNKH